jgi:hypothetical protein
VTTKCDLATCMLQQGVDTKENLSGVMVGPYQGKPLQ